LITETKKKFNYIIGFIGIGLLLILTIFGNHNNYFDIYLFLIFIIIEILLEKTSIKIGDFAITLDVIVTISSYVIFGVIPTLWLDFFAMFVYQVLIERKPLNKSFFNLGMFILAILFSHAIILITRNYPSGIEGIENKLRIVLFGLLYYVFNWFFILLQIFIEKGQIPKSLIESMVWDFCTNFIVIPLSMLLIKLYYAYRLKGMILISILVMGINLFFRLIRNMVFLNEELKLVYEVSASINSRLETKEIIDNIINGIYELIECIYCSVIKYDGDSSSIKTISSKSKENIKIDNDLIDKIVAANICELTKQDKGFIINDISKFKHIPKEYKLKLPDISSMLIEPLIRENKHIGYIFVCSNNKNSFTKEHKTILNILANDAVISLQNARSYETIHDKSIKDSLTLCFNQRYFFEYLDSVGSKCLQCKKEKCTGCSLVSLIIFDLDNYKIINDTYGHQTGDKILKDIAFIIKNNLRENDMVFRYGGDEFTIILPNMDCMGAYNVAERIRIIVEKSEFFGVNGDKIKLTISGGVCDYPLNSESGSSLLSHADRAMYIYGKQQGKNKIGVYSELKSGCVSK